MVSGETSLLLQQPPGVWLWLWHKCLHRETCLTAWGQQTPTLWRELR